MATPIYESLANAALFVETCAHRESLRGLLLGGGYSDALHAEGAALVKSVQEALDHVTAELKKDKIPGHLVHTAATELEMWHQTVGAFGRRSIGESDTRFTDLMAGHLHGPSHTVTAMAQAMRFMALMRLDKDLRADFGPPRRVEDLLQRGFSLKNKLVRLADDSANPALTDASERLSPLALQLEAWLEKVRPIAAGALGDRPFELGLVGVVSEGSAAPLGGSASRVTRHQHTSRKAPAGGPSQPAPGWSVGRQNRNGANVGKGYNRP